MKTKLFLILTLTVILLTFASCGSGITQAQYDEVVANKQSMGKLISEKDNKISEQNTTIQSLQEQLSQAKPPVYFPNRTAIESWLKTVKNLGISKDNEQWLQFALYYQKKSIEAGFILSVSYTINDDNMAVTCDIVTEDGWIYYFDPDKLELQDTRIRVDMVDPKDLETTYEL